MINIKKATTSLVIALALILVLASPVSAGLAVTNAKIQDSVSPGESTTYVMKVTDNSSEPMDIAVEVRGLGNNITGAIEALTAENDLSPYTARPFITALPASFHLEPGQSQDVTVTLTVPGDVGDGGRYADILIYTIPSGGGQIAISVAVGAQALLTIENSNLIISGDITSLEIPQAVSEQLLSATATIQNTGNYHYKLVCNGTVTNDQGQVVGVSWPTDSVYNLIPTFSRQIAVPLNMSQELTPGNYSLEIAAYTQDGVWLDTAYKTFNIAELYKPMPLMPLTIEFFDEGKLSVYQWSMDEDGTLMEKVEASSLTADVSIDILQGTRIQGENGEPPAPISVTALDTPPSPPAGYDTVTAFEFSSNGVTFDSKADITIEYSPVDIPAGISETQLGIKTFDEDTGQWIIVEDSEIDTNNNKISFPVTHFSVYAVFAPASANPTTILGIEKQTWMWIGIGALWVVVAAISMWIVQRRRAEVVHSHDNRRRGSNKPQGPRNDGW